MIKSTKTISNSRFVALVVGESGVGKTSQARFLPERETLILSAEAGLLCLQGTEIDVWEIKTLDDLYKCYEFLTEEPPKYKYVFIDSLTELSTIVLRNLKDDPQYKEAKMILKMYGDYNDRMDRLIRAFRDLTQYSVIFTCLSEKVKDELALVDDFNIEGNKCKSNLKSIFDLVLHLAMYRDGDQTKRVFLTSVENSRLAKDRSGKLDHVEEANIGTIITKVLGA